MKVSWVVTLNYYILLFFIFLNYYNMMFFCKFTKEDSLWIYYRDSLLEEFMTLLFKNKYFSFKDLQNFIKVKFIFFWRKENKLLLWRDVKDSMSYFFFIYFFGAVFYDRKVFGNRFFFPYIFFIVCYIFYIILKGWASLGMRPMDMAFWRLLYFNIFVLDNFFSILKLLFSSFLNFFKKFKRVGFFGSRFLFYCGKIFYHPLFMKGRNLIVLFYYLFIFFNLILNFPSTSFKVFSWKKLGFIIHWYWYFKKIFLRYYYLMITEVSIIKKGKRDFNWYWKLPLFKIKRLIFSLREKIWNILLYFKSFFSLRFLKVGKKNKLGCPTPRWHNMHFWILWGFFRSFFYFCYSYLIILLKSLPWGWYFLKQYFLFLFFLLAYIKLCIFNLWRIIFFFVNKLLLLIFVGFDPDEVPYEIYYYVVIIGLDFYIGSFFFIGFFLRFFMYFLPF